jgi:RNA polymerase sigma-70 factor (ECF subfamily)
MMGRDFRDLAKEYAGPIFTYARYSLRHHQDAEDVTQEVLVRLWRHQDAIEPDRTRAWVMRVARNLVIDLSRRREARSAVFTEGPVAEAAAVAMVAPDAADTETERRRLRQVIEAAIADLNEPYRSIVVMREIQGLAYEEIATGMDMPLGTVKVYLHRARRRLREAMKQEMTNDV